MQSENAVAGVLRLPPLLNCNSATQSAELTPIPHGWLLSSPPLYVKDLQSSRKKSRAKDFTSTTC